MHRVDSPKLLPAQADAKCKDLFGETAELADDTDEQVYNVSNNLKVSSEIVKIMTRPPSEADTHLMFSTNRSLSATSIVGTSIHHNITMLATNIATIPLLANS